MSHSLFWLKKLLNYDFPGLDKREVVLEIWLNTIEDKFFFYTNLLSSHQL